MKNLYQLYFVGAFACLVLAVVFYFMSHRTVTIDISLFVVNDANYTANQTNAITATWLFIGVAFFTGMYYLNSTMRGKNISFRSCMYFLVFLILFFVATTVSLSSFSTTLTTLPFTSNYIYNDAYKKRQAWLGTSFLLYFFMAFFSMVYVYSDSLKLMSIDPDMIRKIG